MWNTRKKTVIKYKGKGKKKILKKKYLELNSLPFKNAPVIFYF